MCKKVFGNNADAFRVGVMLNHYIVMKRYDGGEKYIRMMKDLDVLSKDRLLKVFKSHENSC